METRLYPPSLLPLLEALAAAAGRNRSEQSLAIRTAANHLLVLLRLWEPRPAADDEDWLQL